MMWPVAVLAVLVDHRRLAPGARAAGRSSTTGSTRSSSRSPRQPAGWLVFSIARVARRRRGPASRSPGRSTAARATGPPRSAPGVAVRGDSALEHKLYFDEAYDVVFYRPALGSPPGSSTATSRGRSSSARSAASAPASADVAGRVAAPQTGLVRGYVLALAVGLAVLVVVFLRCGRVMLPRSLIFLPIAAALAIWIFPWPSHGPPAASRSWSPSPSSALWIAAVAQLRLRRDGPPGRRRRHLVLRPRRLLPGRALRLLALARRPDRRS